MRRLTLLLVPVLPLGLILIMAILMVPARAAEAPWRRELDSYLQYKARTSPGTLQLLTIDRAELPWQFTASMSGLTYVKSGTDANGQATAGYLLSGQQLPYPPGDVWCATLEASPMATQDQAPGPTRWEVFVVMHQTLYFDQWVVHEWPQDPDSPPVASIRSSIGCP